MKTLLALLALTVPVLAQDTLSYSYSAKQQAALDIVAATHNANAIKLSGTTPYTPITAKQYLKSRVDEVVNSYEEQAGVEDLKKLTDAYKTATKAKRDAAANALK